MNSFDNFYFELEKKLKELDSTGNLDTAEKSFLIYRTFSTKTMQIVHSTDFLEPFIMLITSIYGEKLYPLTREGVLGDEIKINKKMEKFSQKRKEIKNTLKFLTGMKQKKFLFQKKKEKQCPWTTRRFLFFFRQLLD